MVSAKLYTQPAFLHESALLVKELRKHSEADIRKLMDVSEKIAALNVHRYKYFTTPFTLGNAKQALFAFQGDVYDGFDAQSLDTEALAFAQSHIRILSGLYGILKPLDLIQAYRLEMKIKLKNPRGKDLYHFWGDRLTERLNEELETHEQKVIINLASQEYVKAVNIKQLKAKIITPQFKEKKSGKYKMIALFAKKARGRMARYIAQHHITTPEPIVFFAEDGYRLNVKLSSPQNPVYTRG